MATANVDLVRSLFTRFERGDYASAEWADPQIEYIVADGPAPGTWVGLAQMAECWRDIFDAWDDLGGEVEEYRGLDDGCVLVLTRRRGRGRTSGVEIGQMRSSGAHLLTLRDGIVSKYVFDWDRDRALADLGLEG